MKYMGLSHKNSEGFKIINYVWKILNFKCLQGSSMHLFIPPALPAETKCNLTQLGIRLPRFQMKGSL